MLSCHFLSAFTAAAGNDEGAFSLFDLNTGTELYHQAIGNGLQPFASFSSLMFSWWFRQGEDIKCDAIKYDWKETNYHLPNAISYHVSELHPKQVFHQNNRHMIWTDLNRNGAALRWSMIFAFCDSSVKPKVSETIFSTCKAVSGIFFPFASELLIVKVVFFFVGMGCLGTSSASEEILWIASL